MDPTDAFYQQLDSEDVLKRYGPELARQARQFLAANPGKKVAGLIAAPDAKEAAPLRQARPAGQAPSPDPLTGIIARRGVEPLLTQMVGTDQWLESPGEPQRTLPVVVATRDGFRFGFFGLGTDIDDVETAE